MNSYNGYINKNTTASIGQQVQVTYEDYKKIKGFHDVGFFLQEYVNNGGEVNKNVKRNDMIDVSDCSVSLNDQVLAVETKEGYTSFLVSIPNTIYYLDFHSDGDWWWGTGHPQGASYLTIAEVKTDENGNVQEITDKRFKVGGFRLKDEFGLEDYAKKDVVDAQLAETEQQIAAVQNNKADKTDLLTKRDKSVKIGPLDVDDDLMIMFSPAGAVNPVIPDRSLNSGKTTYLQPKNNLFNAATRIVGYYVDDADGVLKDNIPNYDASDWILVEPNTEYVMNHGGRWAEYDANKVFVTGHTSAELSATTTATTRYVRVSVHQDYTNAYQIEQGSAPTEYEPYTLVFKSTLAEPIEVFKVADNSITPPQVTFMGFSGEGKNKFDKTTVPILYNWVFNTAGTTVASASGGVSFLLPCKASTTYTVSRQTAGTRFRAAYTATDVLVHNVTPVYGYIEDDLAGSITLTGHPSAKYIMCYFWRVADQGDFSRSDLDTVKIQVEEGDQATPYEDYHPVYKIGSEYLPDLVDPVINKVYSIMGDSISTFAGYIPPSNRTRYPQEGLLTDVSDTWWMRLQHATGMTLGVNESWAGSRVSWDGSTESADIGANKHMASHARINNLGNNGTPDIIFFWGGTNDIGASVPLGSFDGSDLVTQNVNTFTEAYATAIIRMQTAYPLARIICMTPMFTGIYSGNQYYPHTRLNVYIDAMRDICKFFGTIFVDLRKCGINIYNLDTYYGDGLHPKANGMELIFDYLYGRIVPILST